MLIVDAAQGIEAQTLANTFLALEHDLEILPVVNKIDLPAADPQRVKDEIENVIGLPAQDAPEISAKVGLNIDAVLEDIVKNVPAPKGDPEAPLRALIFDSQYDAYRGVVVYFRVMEGTLTLDQRVRMMASARSTAWWRSATSCPPSWSPVRACPPGRWATSPPPSKT